MVETLVLTWIPLSNSARAPCSSVSYLLVLYQLVEKRNASTHLASLGWFADLRENSLTWKFTNWWSSSLSRHWSFSWRTSESSWKHTPRHVKYNRPEPTVLSIGICRNWFHWVVGIRDWFAIGLYSYFHLLMPSDEASRRIHRNCFVVDSIPNWVLCRKFSRSFLAQSRIAIVLQKSILTALSSTFSWLM